MRVVGVIGLGRMGLPLARNLLDSGFSVCGYRRSGSPELAAAGGVDARSAAEVAEASDVLVSILPDEHALASVVLGASGTLTALRPGTVHIEMSTIDVAAKSRVRTAVVEAGGDMLDAPISGSPGMVAPRLATTFASGPADSVQRVRPVLEALSGPVVYAGDFGAGAHLKYISCLLMAIHTAAAAEAIVLARRSGLDLDLVQQTLDNSIAGSALLKQRGPVMRSRTWTPAPGPVSMLHPILEQVSAYADSLGLSTSVFAAAKAIFDHAVADGCGELDIAAVHDTVDARSADQAARA